MTAATPQPPFCTRVCVQCSFIFTHRRTHTSYICSDTCIVTAASPQPPFCTRAMCNVHSYSPTDALTHRTCAQTQVHTRMRSRRQSQGCKPASRCTHMIVVVLAEARPPCLTAVCGNCACSQALTPRLVQPAGDNIVSRTEVVWCVGERHGVTAGNVGWVMAKNSHSRREISVGVSDRRCFNSQKRRSMLSLSVPETVADGRATTTL